MWQNLHWMAAASCQPLSWEAAKSVGSLHPIKLDRVHLARAASMRDEASLVAYWKAVLNTVCVFRRGYGAADQQGGTKTSGISSCLLGSRMAAPCLTPVLFLADRRQARAKLYFGILQRT